MGETGPAMGAAYMALRRAIHKGIARCAICKGRDDLDVDHIVPQSRGGGNEASNLQILCKTCHRRKDYHLSPHQRPVYARRRRAPRWASGLVFDPVRQAFVPPSCRAASGEEA